MAWFPYLPPQARIMFFFFLFGDLRAQAGSTLMSHERKSQSIRKLPETGNWGSIPRNINPHNHPKYGVGENRTPDHEVGRWELQPLGSHMILQARII